MDRIFKIKHQFLAGRMVAFLVGKEKERLLTLLLNLTN